MRLFSAIPVRFALPACVSALTLALLLGASVPAASAQALSTTVDRAAARTGDSVAITVSSPTPLAGPPAVTVSGACLAAASVAMEPDTQTTAYTGTYLVPSGEDDCAASVAASGADPAGLPTDGTASFMVDRTAPVASATPGGSLGSNGWYTSEVAVTATATDGASGIAAIYLGPTDACVPENPAGCILYRGPSPAIVVLEVDGSYTLSGFATDGAGNFGPTLDYAVRLDQLPPSAAATLAGTLGTNGWYTSAVFVSLSGRDATSGVASIAYSVDAGPWLSLSGSGTIALAGEGRHGVQFYAVDRAGNAGAPRSASATIDRTPPSAPIDLVAEPGALPGSARLRWSASADATSGVAGYLVRWATGRGESCPADPALYATMRVPAVVATTVSGLDGDTPSCFSVAALDAAGNASAESNLATARANR